MPGSFLLTDREPNATIAFNTTGAVDTGRFLEEATLLARRLPRRRYVLNLFADRYRYMLGFCAATIAGQCTLMPPNRLPPTLERLRQDYRDSYVLGDEEEHLSGAQDVGTTVDDSPRIPGDQLCAIAFTSGSTGLPKAHPKYWSTLHAGTRSNARLLLGDQNPRFSMLATVPPQHMWGFEMSILLPLFANIAISHRMPFFPQDIADALAVLPEHRILVSSPVHLNALLKSGVALPALSRIFAATAPLSEQLARDLEVRFDTVVTDVFGCSEAGVLAMRNAARDARWQASEVFELVSRNDGTLIRAGHLPGEVLMPDIIEVDGRNRFRWIGRHQDMVNIAGKRGSLADLNQRLTAMPGVIDGVIFMPEDGERLAALVVAPGRTVAEVLKHLRSQLDPVFLPRPLYLVRELPRQETGKLARKAMLEMFSRISEAKEQTEARKSDT
jgi:acyl-coenzyme A synthetase/AMP-(fatty) acid ligase